MKAPIKIYALIMALAAGLCLSPLAGNARADDFQEPPYDFLFGNHIDTHQANRLRLDGYGNPLSLRGFFYIIFTGETDEASGLPIARHPRGADKGEDCNDDDTGCKVGWLMRGLPGDAKFLYHSGVNGNDHPVWLVNRVDIPQRGSYTHFHWVTKTSTDPRVGAVPAACDKKNAGQLEDVDPVATNLVCPGWFLQIRAVRNFAFDHGGEIIPVRLGIDNKSHLNLVTNYEALVLITDDEVVELITPTR